MNRIFYLVAVFAAVCTAKYTEDPLDNEGVWIQWHKDNDSIPHNAVYGGMDLPGASFVMRAFIMTPEGVPVGYQIGKFFPTEKRAYTSFNGMELPMTSFELLTHNGPIWSGKDDERPAIPGIEENLICRIRHNTFYWTPGYLDKKFCYVSYDGGVLMSPGYEVLRRMC